jgi:hypothetical protein
MKKLFENNFRFLSVLLLILIAIFTGWIAINLELVMTEWHGDNVIHTL